MMGFIDSLFGSGAKQGNEIRNRNSREGASKLTAGAIGETARGLIGQRGSEFAAIGAAGQLGVEAQRGQLDARMAQQGLGGTGLGASFSGASRAGAAFQSNQLRAALSSEIYGQALQANTAAGQMIASTFIENEPAAFGTALQSLGSAAMGIGALLPTGED
jgi:hypothetical protein